jgi:hypothetical protein
MSIFSTVRDINEILTEVTSVNSLPLSKAVSEVFFYLLNICKFQALRFLSFRWIFNFSLLPLKIPAYCNSVFKETHYQTLFDFLQVIQLEQNPLVLGLLNSIFLTIPVSIVHFSAIRRLLIQGIPAASYSLGGYVLGQIFFISCVIFGIQSIIIPWLTLEPLNYILGLIIIGRIIYSTRFESFMELKTWRHPKYKSYFITSFLLAWCEQGSLFQFLGNITFSANPTILQAFNANHLILNFLQNFIYVLGLLIGSVIFTGCWMWLFLRIKKAIFDRYLFLPSKFVNRLNSYIFLFTTIIGLATIPYYTLFSMVLGPLGFVSEDSALNSVTNAFSNYYIDEAAVELLSFISIDPEVIEFKHFPFNRGSYLVFPEIDHTLSIEDLAYGAEFAWLKRVENPSTGFVVGHHRGRNFSKKVGGIKGQLIPTNKGKGDGGLTLATFATRGRGDDKKGDKRPKKKRRFPNATPLINYRFELNEEFSPYNSTFIFFIAKIMMLDFFTDLSQYEKIQLQHPKFLREVHGADPFDKKEQLLINRWHTWYDLDDIEYVGSDEISSNFIAKNALQTEACFPSSFNEDQVFLNEEHPAIGLRIRQYYNQSFIYKFLIKLDIEGLLSRQPRKYRLNSKQELDLFMRRIIASGYYDRFRYYMRFSTDYLLRFIFKEFFGGSKNINSQVYSHQFTGTFRNLNRFFSLRLDDDKNRNFVNDKFLNYIDHYFFDTNQHFKFVTYNTFKYKVRPCENQENDTKPSESTNSKITKGENANIEEDKNVNGVEENNAETKDIDNGDNDMSDHDINMEDHDIDDKTHDNEIEDYDNDVEGQDVDEDEDDVKYKATYSSKKKKGIKEEKKNNYLDEIQIARQQRLDELTKKVSPKPLPFPKIIPESDDDGYHRSLTKKDLEKIDRNKAVLKFDQSLYILSKSDIGPEPHEELYHFLNNKIIKEAPKKIVRHNITFKERICLPLYVGWDKRLRKLAISNKSVIKKFTGSFMAITPQLTKASSLDFTNNYLHKTRKHLSAKIKNFLKIEHIKKNKETQVIKFACWPLPDNVFTWPPNISPFPYLVLKEDESQTEFESMDDLSEDLFFAADTRGLTFTRKWMLENLREAGRDPRSLLTYFVPAKGGYFWPGNRDTIRINGHINKKKEDLFNELIEKNKNKPKTTEASKKARSKSGARRNRYR